MHGCRKSRARQWHGYVYRQLEVRKAIYNVWKKNCSRISTPLWS